MHVDGEGSRARSRSGRARAALVVAAFAGGLVALTAAAYSAVAGTTVAESAEPSAQATLVQLTIADVPRIGLTGFDGRYGLAGTPDTGQPSSSDEGDFSDPDGVLDHASFAGTTIARTSWATPPGQLTAQVHTTGAAVALGNAERFVSVGTIDAYAQCTPPSVLAYLRTEASLITVLGQPVPEGTSTLPVTGTDLGLKFDTGVLTVTVTRTETQQPPDIAAAGLTIDVQADLADSDGNPVYSGDLLSVTFGDASVDCATSPTPSPSPAPTPSPTPTPTPTSSPSPSPTLSPTPSPTPSPSPSPSPTPGPSPSPTPGPSPSPSLSPTPSPTLTSSPSPSPSPTPGPSPGPSPTPGPSPSPSPSGSPSPSPAVPPTTASSEPPAAPPLPDTGTGLMWTASLGLALAGAGLAAAVLARRRPR